MVTLLDSIVPELELPPDAVAHLAAAREAAPRSEYTPEADEGALRSLLERGERNVSKLMLGDRSTSDGVPPCDLALIGTLAARLLPQRDFAVDGDATTLDRLAPPASRTCVTGSLTVRGNLTVYGPLIVCGDLEVAGTLSDCGPQSTIAVFGNVRCGSLITDGEILVRGDLTAENFVYGEHNDNVLEVQGTLRAPVLVSSDHGLEAGRYEVVHETSDGLPVFDVYGGDGVEQLRSLVVDPALLVDEDGDFDAWELAALPYAWKRA